MANGMVMGLASKKSALFSQYRRAEEIPVFVNQYSVMLSRRSDPGSRRRPGVPAGSAPPVRAGRCRPPWSSMNAAQVGEGSARQPVQRLRTRGHDLGVRHVLAVEGAQLLVGKFLLGDEIRGRRVAALDRLVDGGRGGTWHVGVDASTSSGGAWMPIA